MSFRYVAAINKPGFNPLAAQTPTILYNLFGWGNGSSGQLGLNNRTYYSSPAQVGSLTNWLSLSSSYISTAAVKTDGSLWTWGRGLYGALGLGNETNYSSPKQVGALTSWLRTSGGYGCTGAVKTDGTLWMFGAASNYGQLGLGNITSYSSPKQVGALTNWSRISFSALYNCFAIKTDGTLWSWGYNGYGMLGLGNTTNYSSPKQIGALTGWSKVSAGNAHILSVKTDGTLWSWGNNSSGQLGLGTSGGGTYKSSPTQIGALSTWSDVGGGYICSFAVKTDGTIWAWGASTAGVLGLGNNTSYSSPKQIGVLTTWSKPFTSNFGAEAAAIKTDGTLWTWGGNAQGALGLGNRTNYSSPKQVGSSTTWLTLTVGGVNMLGIG